MTEKMDTPFLYNSTSDKTLYYQVKPLTVLFFVAATWGFYCYWWHYQNWRLIQKNSEATISPFIRAFFHPLFSYSLFDNIAETTKSLKIKGAFLLRFFGVVNVIAVTAWFDLAIEFIPFIGWLFAVSVFDIAFVQIKVVSINKEIGQRIAKGLSLQDWLLLLIIAAEITTVVLLVKQ